MREEWKTWGDVFDQFTLRTLFKLESEGHFDRMVSPIALGKEANVFTAEKDGSLVCIKIYRLEVADFNKMHKYIHGDPRFEGLSKHRRKTIFAWCQREFRNMMIARDAGCSVPKPLAFSNNVLIMEFIGEKEAYPMLKNRRPENPKKFFEEVKNQMRLMHKAKLVHGDLSEYNILNVNEKPVLIDLSHGTLLTARISKELLERDIKNISKYFIRSGVKINEEKFMKEVVGK